MTITRTDTGCMYALSCDVDNWQFLTYVVQIPPNPIVCDDGFTEEQNPELSDAVCNQETGTWIRSFDGATIVAMLCNLSL